MKRKLLGSVTLATVCFAFIAVYYVYSTDNGDRRSALTAEPSSTLPSPKVGKSARSSASMTSASSVSALPTSYADAKDFRVFFYSAIALPQQGGVFYASEAVRTCSTMSMHTAEEFGRARSATNSYGDNRKAVARLAALDRLKARCSGFQPDELASLNSLQKAGLERGDPLVAASKALHASIASKDVALAQKAVLNVLQLNDPVLLEQMGMSMAVVSSGDQTPSFRGQPLSNDDFRHYSMAWSLAQCQLSNFCRANDVWADQLCALHGVCVDGDREEAVRELYKSDPTGLARTLDLTNQILRSVRSGDVGAFASVNREATKK